MGGRIEASSPDPTALARLISAILERLRTEDEASTTVSSTNSGSE